MVAIRVLCHRGSVFRYRRADGECAFPQQRLHSNERRKLTVSELCDGLDVHAVADVL